METRTDVVDEMNSSQTFVTFPLEYLVDLLSDSSHQGKGHVFTLSSQPRLHTWKFGDEIFFCTSFSSRFFIFCCSYSDARLKKTHRVFYGILKVRVVSI